MGKARSLPFTGRIDCFSLRLKIIDHVFYGLSVNKPRRHKVSVPIEFFDMCVVHLK